MTLRQLLALDATYRGLFAAVGILLADSLAGTLGLPARLLHGLAMVSGVCGLTAARLLSRRTIPDPALRILIGCNCGWVIISSLLLRKFLTLATPAGVGFLAVQVLVAGGLAWAESRRLRG